MSPSLSPANMPCPPGPPSQITLNLCAPAPLRETSSTTVLSKEIAQRRRAAEDEPAQERRCFKNRNISRRPFPNAMTMCCVPRGSRVPRGSLALRPSVSARDIRDYGSRRRDRAEAQGRRGRTSTGKALLQEPKHLPTTVSKRNDNVLCPQRFLPIPIAMVIRISDA